MSAFGQQLKTVLGITAVVSLYGIVTLLVWALGPDDMSVRIILIALILMTLPLAVLIAHLRKKQNEKKAAGASRAALQKPAPPAQEMSAPTRSYDELTRAAEETVQWLRNTKLGAEQPGGAVYRLPWFLIAGPPASGKTSLVLSSGLDFHALPSQRNAELHVVRPTRDCQWRVTRSAVLLDTSGRYTTEGPDRDEWSALIETMKSFRKDRPLDGLLMVVSVARLSASGEAEIEREAKLLRTRIDEVIARVRARFPVYLVFTHSDSIEGFADFFRPFTASEREQAWGTTFPLEQAANAHALFDVEFDYLHDTLMQRRLLRMSTPGLPDEQLRVFDFPLRFQDARRKLGLFTSTLFRPNPFSESPLLRGLYFTSSLADDQGAKAAAMRDPQKASGAAASLLSANDAPREYQSVGQGYFTQDLFNEVLLRDKDLAASFQASKQRSHRLRNALLAAAAALVSVFFIGTIISFFNNKSLIAEASEAGNRVNAIRQKDASAKDAKLTREELGALDALRKALLDLHEYERGSRPLRLRFGLYSGSAINRRLLDLYFERIDKWFFIPSVVALKSELQSFAAAPAANPAASSAAHDAAQGGAPGDADEDELGRHYDLLKAYLMLSELKQAEPKIVEPTFLANQLWEFWKKSSPADLEDVARQQLDFYARQLSYELEGREGDPPASPQDPKIIEEVRGKLVAYPAVKRYYKRITTEIDGKLQAVTVERVVKGAGKGLLTGSYAVPGSFTIEGYYEYVRDAFESASKEMGKEDWVMGAQPIQTGGQSADVGYLRTLYFGKYIEHWQKFLAGVKVQSYDLKRKANEVEALRTLASPNSPMDLLMNEVARNTRLSIAPTKPGVIGWIKGLFASKTGGVAEGKAVEEEFEPLFQFVSTEGDKNTAGISQYRGILGKVADEIAPKSDQQLKLLAAEMFKSETTSPIQVADEAIKNLLINFKGAAARNAAGLLEKPLANLKFMLSGGGCDEIERIWNQQLYKLAHDVEQGFPFTESGSAKVADLTRFLNPVDGEFTKFLKNNVGVFFDTVDGKWVRKDSSDCTFSDAFVLYLNNALRLQAALFPGNSKDLKITYELKLQTSAADDVTTILAIDGNTIEAKGNASASKKFIWPAPEGENIGVKATAKQGDREVGTHPPVAEVWGVFKAFAGSGNQYTLSWTLGQGSLRATITPDAANHPFKRNLFTEMHAPMNLK
ncbi:MAG: type secretion system protein ImpL [Blastocatellia bacterium]